MCSTNTHEADTSTESLERELCELSAHLAAGMCRWLLLVGEFDERRAWAASGALSCAHWLSWRCGIGLRAGYEQVRVAGALRTLPLISNAFAAGELSYSKVRAMTRIANAENEEYLLTLGQHASGAQLEKIVSGYRRAVRGSRDVARRAYEERYLYTSYGQDGSMTVEARVPVEDGAILVAALDQVCTNAGFESDECSAEQSPGRLTARRADALIALARSELAGATQGQAAADPVEVVVHVDVQSLAEEETVERCELEGGPVIAPETARRLSCDGGVRRILERDGKPLSVGRRTRSVPPALKRVLRDRDQGRCRFPGCTHKQYLHAHHIQHWARGGPTDLDNLVQLCSHHHRLVHEGGYQVERGGPEGLRFLRPNGWPIPERPPRSRATGPGLAAQHERRGVAIDDHTCKPLSSGQPCDYGMAVEGLLQEEGRLEWPLLDKPPGADAPAAPD
jgi:transposase